MKDGSRNAKILSTCPHKKGAPKNENSLFLDAPRQPTSTLAFNNPLAHLFTLAFM